MRAGSRVGVVAWFGFLALWQPLARASTPEPPRVSVLRFYQQVEHILEGCRGFEWTEQGQLRTELERALVREGVVVLERADIERLYDREHYLVNADPRGAPKRGRFKTAQFSITGGLTELGICDETGREGVSLGGVVSWLGGPSDVDLDLSRRKTISTAKVAAQLVSVETGQIVRSFEARSQIEDTGISVGVGMSGVGASKRTSGHAPVERVTNQAIQDLARQIAAYLSAIPARM
jgi:curli biogenesis system outer membrane secretion channel CsgG